MQTIEPLQSQLAAACPRIAQGSADGDPLVAPIVQSTTFCRDGIDSQAPHQYSRVSNPTVSALERALGELENAPPAVCFTTGLAAETALFLALLQRGDHVVCSRALYGGTVRLLEQVLSGLGITTSFVDTTDLAAVQAAVQPATKLIFVETPANPTLDLTDLCAVADIAHAAGAKLAVDNTFLTPLLQQPLDCGADFCVTSTTKFIEGHSAALGGAVTSRDEDGLEALRFIRKCTGAIQTPLDAWLTLQGIKTLPVRLQHQSATAAELANWLAGRDDVRRVHYPSLGDARSRRIAATQHLGAHGAVLSFELVGGLEHARSVAQRASGFRLVEHVGSVETLITHSATMTHAGVSKEQREAVGVTDGLLRLSVGLEPAATLRAELEAALEACAPQQEEQEEVVTCSATL